MEEESEGSGQQQSTSMPKHGLKVLTCKFCNMKFTQSDEYIAHVEEHKRGEGEALPTGNDQPAPFRHSSALQDSLNRAVKSMDTRRARVSRNQLNLKANQTAALMRAQQMQIRHARESIESNGADVVQPNFNGFFKCELCDKIFHKMPNYKLHLRIHNKQFACIVCGLKFASQTHLTLHFRTHTGEKPFQCSFPDCPWKFARKDALKVHYKRYHGLNVKSKRQCNPERATPNFIQGVDKLPLELDDNSSEEVTTNNSNIILKTMLENYPCKSEPCDEDDKTVQAIPTVSYQQPKPKKNLPPLPPLIRIPLASAMTPKKPAPPSLLRWPLQKSLHSVLTCQKSGEIFTSRHDLTVHNLMKPSSQRPLPALKPFHSAGMSPSGSVDPNLPYLCPLCNKGFKDKKALACHKWYHRRELTYPCTVTGCEKLFKLKDDLIRHMRCHLEERPHACPEIGCESRCYQKYNVVRHLRKSHNQVEDVSYSCQHCSDGFSKPHLWVRHMKSCHPEQDTSHLMVLQMLDQKKKAEKKQMQEFLANLRPEEEEEETGDAESE